MAAQRKRRERTVTPQPPPVTVADVLAACDEWAPPALAEDGDNVGLQAGDPAAAAAGVLLTCDLTTAVVAEATRLGCNVVVAHHPPLYAPARSLRADDPERAALLAALRAGLHVIAMHTNYDAADGGVNDVLAALVGLADVRPLGRLEAGGRGLEERPPAASLKPPASSHVKLVVFTPAADVAAVQRAAFAAGAGRIGDYAECSFRVAGVGSFRGGPGTNPAVGKAGRREDVDEWRLEMICPQPRLAEVLAAVRAAHSYEEPAIDVYPLAEGGLRLEAGGLRDADAPPAAGPKPPASVVRLGVLRPAKTVEAVLQHVKQTVKVPAVGVVGLLRRRVRTVAVVGGSGGGELAAVRAAGAELLVTGELRHHEAAAAAEAGLSVLLLGHWHSERPAMAAVAPRLAARFAGLPVRVSHADAPPVHHS